MAMRKDKKAKTTTLRSPMRMRRPIRVEIWVLSRKELKNNLSGKGTLGCIKEEIVRDLYSRSNLLS